MTDKAKLALLIDRTVRKIMAETEKHIFVTMTPFHPLVRARPMLGGMLYHVLVRLLKEFIKELEAPDETKPAEGKDQ